MFKTFSFKMLIHFQTKNVANVCKNISKNNDNNILNMIKQFDKTTEYIKMQQMITKLSVITFGKYQMTS